MNILTRNGYKDITLCQIGDEVLYYDLFTGQVAYNTIEVIEEHLPTAYPLTRLECLISEEEYIDEKGEVRTREVTTKFEVPTTNDQKWYVVNNTYTFFALETVWSNLNIKHSKDLKIGDIIYDDNDEDIEITSIETFEDVNKIWYRLRISGDCSFIANGITLHNASRYWVDGTANWDTSTNNWSSTSGGLSGASKPTSADDVYFDNGSTAADYVVTLYTSECYANNLYITKPTSYTISFVNTSYWVNIYGTVATLSGVVTSAPAMNKAGGTGDLTLTTGGNNLPGLKVTTGKSLILTENLTCSSFQFVNSGAGLTTNNYSVNCSSLTFNSTNHVVYLGSSTITSTSSCNLSGTFTTLDAGTSNLILSSSAGSLTIGSTNITLYDVQTNGTSTSTLSGSGGTLICNNFTRTPTSTKYAQFKLTNANLTVNGTLNMSGYGTTDRLLVASGTIGTRQTITCNGTLTTANTDFRDITGAGSVSWDLSAITGNSGNCGNNSGITFTTPVTTNWQSGTTWSTATWSSRVPLPQDTATFTTAGTVTISNDMPRVGTVDWTGSSNKTWSTLSQSEVYGSINLTNLTTLSADSTTYYLYGRGSYSITSAGKTWAKQILFDCASGTYSFTDDYIGTALQINTGTWTTNSFNVTLSLSISATGAGVKTFNFGSSLITFTGTGTLFSVSASNTTMNAGTSTIKYTNNSTSAKTFAGGGLTYYKLWVATAGDGTFTITGSNTFNNITLDVGRTLRFTGNTTTTFTGDGIVINGTGSTTTITSSSAVQHTLTKSSGTVTVDNCNISYSKAQGGASWIATNSINGGNNTGWNFGGVVVNYATLLFRFI